MDQPGHLEVVLIHGFDSTTASYRRSLCRVTDSSCQVCGFDSMIAFAFAMAFTVSVVMFRRRIGANSRPKSSFLNSSVLV